MEGLGGGVAEDAKGASGKGRVPWSVLESHGITTKSVLKPSVVVISATRCSHTATSVALTDADRWEKHREAVWQTVGDARGGDVIVPDGDDGALRRIGCIEHEERDEANDRWKKRGAGGRKQRIRWLLDGDQRCRFSKGTTTRPTIWVPDGVLDHLLARETALARPNMPLLDRFFAPSFP